MTSPLERWLGRALLVLSAICTGPALAQASDLAPAHVELPQARSGALLVLLTGVDGAPNHLGLARDFAREGWVVHVVDSNRLMPETEPLLEAQLKWSLARPDVRSTKAAVVGYSLGGWLVLSRGNRIPDLVAATVAAYPSTFRAGEPRTFLASPPVKVPTLLMAGVKDTYMGCCLIERARALAATAASPEVRAPIELVEYPQADHGFVLPAFPQVYRPDDAADALRRANAFLRQHLPR